MAKQILIAGTSSGVGKTTITMGLIAALRRRGLRVQPFKAGPDYIDPTYHTLAAGRPCRNIDTWMTPPAWVAAQFARLSAAVDVAVIEGVMGLFDGFSYSDDTGSTAQIAKLLGTPVLLILDVGKMARSGGALALGYTRFDPALNVAGFILNRCGSVGHYEGVKLAVEQATARPAVGWLPKEADLHIPERHLGLVPTDERGELSAFIHRTADLIEHHFHLDLILSLASETPPPPSIHHSSFIIHHSSLLLAVARDAAFSFYYEENLDLLREAGAEIVFFSPQTDAGLPPGTSGVYLGGGFPELFAAQLAANEPMKESLRQAHGAGLPIYAECGGLMYLTEGIVDLEGRRYPMVGLVPGETRMQNRRAGLGYRVVESPGGNFLLPAGVTTRGHEFHWSTWTPPPGQDAPAWRVYSRDIADAARQDVPFRADGYARGNLLASYIHLHFAHNPQLAANFVRACSFVPIHPRDMIQ
jgi:cobyrinic acid a,c-diamide synthase